jgi:hypothetical protein
LRDGFANGGAAAHKGRRPFHMGQTIMRIFIFKSESNSELRAFSGDPGGEKLTSRFGPWHAVGVIRPDKDPPFNISRDTIEQAIANPGFQLFRMKTKQSIAG